MEKREYREVVIADETSSAAVIEKMNQLGEQGWRFPDGLKIGVVSQGPNVYALMHANSDRSTSIVVERLKRRQAKA